MRIHLTRYKILPNSMKRLEIDYSLGVMDALVGIARYNFVNRVINNAQLKVLDYGCGSGYGSRILKEKFQDVTSFDIYPDDYTPKDIEVCQDVSKLNREEFDIITCFEVIEHLDKDQQDQLMNKLHSLLSPSGTLFISTVRKIDPPPTENRRKEHVRELSFEELFTFCDSRFNAIYTFGQVDQTITTFHKDNHYHFVFICTNKK